MTVRDSLSAAGFRAIRRILALRRPSPGANRRDLLTRGESLEDLTLREAVVADIPALAALHVATWNDAYAPFLTGLRPRVVRRFLSARISTMSAYVDPRNPSCGFFERLGAEWLVEPNGRVNFSWYIWRDLPGLARRCPIA